MTPRAERWFIRITIAVLAVDAIADVHYGRLVGATCSAALCALLSYWYVKEYR